MAVSYKRLWHLLLDRNLLKKDLEKLAGISSSSITKLGRDEYVNLEILQKVCTALQCDITEIMEMGPDDPTTLKNNVN